MPMWSENQSKAKFQHASLGGNDVSFSSEPNSKGNYKDANNDPLNHDRGFIAEMPVSTEHRTKEIITDVIEAGKVAAAAATEAMDNARQAAQNAGEIFDPRDGLGGTTGTIVIYNPQSFTVDIGSRGDSPAFLMLDDGNKVAAIKLTTGVDAQRNKISNSLNAPPGTKPTREGTYQIGSNPEFIGTIDLQTVIDQAVAEYGLNTATLTSGLLVASDGILKPYPANGDLTMQDEQEMAVRHYEQAKQACAHNIADGITRAVIKGGSKDNMTNQFVADIQKGKGKPLAMVVTDGYYVNGFLVAEHAIKAMEKVVQKEIGIAALSEASVIKKGTDYCISFSDPRISPPEKINYLEAIKHELHEGNHANPMVADISRDTLVVKGATPHAANLLDEIAMQQGVRR